MGKRVFKLAKGLIDPKQLFIIVADLNIRIQSVTLSCSGLAPIPQGIAGKLIIRIHLKKKISRRSPPFLTHIFSDSSVQILVLFWSGEKAIPILLKNQVVIVVIEPLNCFLLGFLIQMGGLLTVFFSVIIG